MGNTYKDEKGHFTDKEHDGGTCIHEGRHGTVHLNKSGDYEVRDRRGNKVGNGFSTDKEAIEFLDGDFEDEDYEDDVEKYTGREPGGIKGDLERAGFQKVEVVDDKTLTFEGPDTKTWTVKENENLGFDVYNSEGKKVIEDVNANRENVATRILQREQGFNSAEDKYDEYAEKGKSTWNQKLSKGQKVIIKDRNGNDMEAYIGGFYNNQKLQDEDTYEEGKDNLWHDFRGVQLVDKDGKEIGNINANQIEKVVSETEEYKPFEGNHNYLVNRMYNSSYDTPEEVYEDAKRYNLSDKEKWGLDEEVKRVFGVSDEELEKIKAGPDKSLSEEERKSSKRSSKEKELKDLLNKYDFNISSDQLNSMSDGEMSYLKKKVKDFEDVKFNSSKYKNANEVLDKIIKSIWKKTEE